MNKYNPKKIEAKWQKFWTKNKLFEVKEDAKKQKFYSLIEFPYPSAEGLHVGHPRPFTAMDVVSRKKRMEGYNVLFPIGFDAFGLPTENFAIKTGRAPAEVTKQNIKNFTRQLKMLGYSFDWSRQVDTSDPKYYKWTQWLFLQFFKHGLAYKKAMPINWCPSCKIGLANEEVVDGKCERCGTPVEKRNKEQWMLAITKYAEKLLDGLKNVDYIPRAKVQQENWIGKSEGALVRFKVSPSSQEGAGGVAEGVIKVFVNPHWSPGSLTEENISDTLPDFSVQTILDKFTLAVKNSLRKLGLVIKDGVAKVKELVAGRVRTDELCVGQTCIKENQLLQLLQGANANNPAPYILESPQSPITNNQDTINQTNSNTQTTTVENTQTTTESITNNQDTINQTTTTIINNQDTIDQTNNNTQTTVENIQTPVPESAPVVETPPAPVEPPVPTEQPTVP